MEQITVGEFLIVSLLFGFALFGFVVVLLSVVGKRNVFKRGGGRGGDAMVIGDGVAVRGEDGKPGKGTSGGDGGRAFVAGRGIAIGGKGGDAL